MNEKIKAIGQQAGFAFIEDGVYGQRWYTSKCGMDASEYEKLVRLIVMECADAGSYYGGNVKYLILKHFGIGVEE